MKWSIKACCVTCCMHVAIVDIFEAFTMILWHMLVSLKSDHILVFNNLYSHVLKVLYMSKIASCMAKREKLTCMHGFGLFVIYPSDSLPYCMGCLVSL